MFFLWSEFGQLCSVTGRSGMILLLEWLQLSCETWTDVVVRTGTDAEKVY